jgi:hypothetical protein
MICETRYLDKNGNEAVAYYGNLHLGHDKALSLYLKSMAPSAFTKFSKKKGMSLDDLMAESKA